jgi:hypothetical protein
MSLGRQRCRGRRAVVGAARSRRHRAIGGRLGARARHEGAWSRPAPAVWRLTRSALSTGLPGGSSGKVSPLLRGLVRRHRGHHPRDAGTRGDDTARRRGPGAQPRASRTRRTARSGRTSDPAIRRLRLAGSAAYETRWAWLEGNQPNGEIALVHYLAATDAVRRRGAAWHLTLHARTRSAVLASNDPGGAVFNPWAARLPTCRRLRSGRCAGPGPLTSILWTRRLSR